MISGTELFCRYALPPNLLSYCGPDDAGPVSAAASGISIPAAEMTQVALAFQGAWPYLELIGRGVGEDPLERSVVEAYWIGSPLLDQIESQYWGNSVADRFGRRAGTRRNAVTDAILRGGSPNHAFHVFCVYPWVGLLSEGHIGPSMEVLDNCRISWGTVESAREGEARVWRRPLNWRGEELAHGEPVLVSVRVPTRVSGLQRGSVVSIHWGTVCQPLDAGRLSRLSRSHDTHLAIANHELRRHRVEPEPASAS